MKYPFLLLFLYLFISCNMEVSDVNTRLTGMIDDALDSTKIYLTDFYFGDVGGYVDSTYVLGGTFEFVFYLDEPRIFQINGIDSPAKHMLLSPGKSKLRIASVDSIRSLQVVDGSPECIQYEQYFKEHGYNRDMDYVMENPNSLTSLIILWEIRFRIPKEDLVERYAGLTERWKSTTAAVDLKKMIESDYNPEVGAIFSDFKLKDDDNNVINLEHFRSKYLLIEFTASWCKPCIDQIPHQKIAYEMFREEDFEILHIYLEEREKMIHNTEKHGIPWKSVYAAEKFRSKVALQNRVFYLPSMFLLDKEHRIIGTTRDPNLRKEGLQRALEGIFE